MPDYTVQGSNTLLTLLNYPANAISHFHYITDMSFAECGKNPASHTNFLDGFKCTNSTLHIYLHHSL